MGYNIIDVLTNARNNLIEAGVQGSRDAEFLLESVIGQKVTFLGRELNEDEYYKYQQLVTRRINREPMDSILGFTEFLGLKIPFNSLTLTPRQETEIMVDKIIADNKSRPNLRILDMCSGSGCIGLAVAKHLTNAQVTLSDISKEALTVSQENARLNNITVDFIESDLFSNIKGVFDIIITNPPYIPSIDIEGLETEVKDYDPVLALDGGEDGLDFYRRMSIDMKNHLVDGGLVYMEFGIHQAQKIVKMLEPDFDKIEVIKDYSGIDRYIKARKRVYVK